MEKQVILTGIFSDGNMTFIQGLGGISLIEEAWMKKNKESFDKKKSKNSFTKTSINTNYHATHKINP